MSMSKINVEASLNQTNYMPDETISFNPSQPADVEALLSKFGPEGLWEIGNLLIGIANDDIHEAMQEADRAR